MSLFQNSVLNKYLKQQDKDAVAKAYKKFTKYFHNPEIQQNIRERKEEQFQEGFLTELFVNVFGYTLAPNSQFNLTTEFKNEKGAKKADGAILKDGIALGVIELKSTKTKDLEKVRQQAFDYKANQTGCVYVITSNFEKIRFYINNAVDWEEFDLFTITEERFALLYLCLAKENIFNNIPLKTKDASIKEEEAITKKFYADYSLFKRELYRDLVKENIKNEVFRAELSKEDSEGAVKKIKFALFKKSQKLIDRFLFIFFAEDRGLLPPNSTIKILDQWKTLKELDEDIPLYKRYIKYFNYLDTGRKGTDKTAEIFAYNGGLFKTDNILDSLIIDDELLYKHTRKLSLYDFESQVDVNILGHIFENSLNEIENVNAEIEGADFEKQTTKRKKDGVFYTPKYITKYIVDNTVGKLCTDKKSELGIIEDEYLKSRKGRPVKTLKALQEKLEEYRNWMLSLTICDPACGSGAFLNQALDFLIKEHQYIDELQTSLLGGGFVFPDIENTVLEKNIYGVDINEESVEIAKLSLWLRTAQPRRKLNELNNNIKCGNSLIDSKTVAGDKAFNWQEEFPHIFSDKKKKAWHITTAIHNSRYSQRMFDYNIKTDDASWLSENDEIVITEIIAKIVKEDKLNVVEYNICGDHMHLLLVCEKEELTKIVGKIKGKSARLYNSNKGINPLVRLDGEKSVSLWTQKFGKSEIKDKKYLNNAIEYIRNNRIKHELPKSERIEKIKKEFLCSKEYAFRKEYNSGFDVVIGNPPYVSNGMNDALKCSLKEKYQTAQYQLELYIAFIEKGVLLINNNGIISFIVPNSWLKNMMMSECRKFLLNNLNIESIIPSLENVFPDASVDTLVFIGDKQKIVDNTAIYEFKDKELVFKHIVNQNRFKKNDRFIFDVEVSKEVLPIINKMQSEIISVGKIFDVIRGINPYDKYTGQTAEVIKNRAYHSDCKKDDSFVPELKGLHTSRYNYSWDNKHFISYGDWLAAPRPIKYFKGERIVFREILGKTLVSTLISEDFKIDRSLYIARLEDDSSFNIRFVLGILNSKLMAFYFRYTNNEFDNLFPKIRVAEFKKLPIKKSDSQLGLSDNVNSILSLTNNFTSIKGKYTKYLQSQFNIEKLSKKLQNWHELKFADFIKELNKAIKKVNGEKLSKLDEMEWMEVFETKKAEAQVLKSEIDKTDKEIDQMVYELYGLSEEEIKIVEGS